MRPNWSEPFNSRIARWVTLDAAWCQPCWTKWIKKKANWSVQKHIPSLDQGSISRGKNSVENSTLWNLSELWLKLFSVFWGWVYVSSQVERKYALNFVPWNWPQDPILQKKFQRRFLCYAEIDQLEKLKIITWPIWLVEFQFREKFYSSGPDCDT